MSKTMTLEVLSSIKGAESSEAVDKLFGHIKNAKTDAMNKTKIHAVSVKELRNDEVHESSDLEKSIIRDNFPEEKNGFLVVSKVIEE